MSTNTTSAPSPATAGSASFTYAEFEKAVWQAVHNIRSAPGEPSAEYEAAIVSNPDAVKLADESWRKGMEELQTSLLNWAYDKIAVTTPEGYDVERVRKALESIKPYAEAISVFAAHIPILAKQIREKHPILTEEESKDHAVANMLHWIC